MEDIEIWRTIEEFPAYEVSNMGRVRVKKTGKIRKFVVNKNTGYSMVMLRRNHKYYNKYVHRIVCQTFIANAQGLPEVDHVNHNRTDNRVENLRWSSRHENMFARGKYYTYRYKPIQQIDAETGAVVAMWNDYVEAGKGFGIRPNRIAQVLDPEETGHLTLFGFIFRFVL